MIQKKKNPQMFPDTIISIIDKYSFVEIRQTIFLAFCV